MTQSPVYIYANEFTIATSEHDIIIALRFKNHAAGGTAIESYVMLSPVAARELATLLTQAVDAWDTDKVKPKALEGKTP